MTEKKEYNIIGKNITLETKKYATAYLNGRKDGAAIFFEGEYIKTPGDLMFINIARNYFKKYFSEIGLDNEFEFSDNQIHFLPADIFRSYFSEQHMENSGIYVTTNQGIYINKDIFRGDWMMMYKTLFHEITHMASFLKFEIQDNVPDHIGSIRSGYAFVSRDKQTMSMKHFNEIIVERFVYEFFDSHRRELLKKFKINLNKNEELYLGYYPLEILDAIIEGVARAKGEKEYAVWKRFEKGLFTGTMMHLREVERVFGPESLRMLSRLELVRNSEIGGEKEEEYNKILNYFQNHNYHNNK